MKRYLFSLCIVLLICIVFTGKSEGKMVLPASLQTVEDNAFMNNTSITEVVIPEECVSIGENAFANCTNIQTIYIPESVDSIGVNAFANCESMVVKGVSGSYAQEWCDSNEISFIEYSTATPGLTYRIENGQAIITGVSGNNITDLIIPRSIDGYKVIAIDSYAFSGRTDIKGNLSIANGVKSIGDSAFKGCSGLIGDLIIPDSVTTIGISSFSGCSGFSGELVIPNSVEVLKEWVFEYCSGLSGLILPDSVISIGPYAFRNCSCLSGELRIPSFITRIERGIFSQCSGLSGELIIPNDVTFIGDGAFYGCSSFTGELHIPDNVVSIEANAFQNCSGFTAVHIGKSVKTIGNNAFSGLSSVNGDLMIPDNVISIGTRAFAWSGWDGRLTLSENLSSISSEAFFHDNFSGTLSIPSSVKLIDNHAFYDCKRIESIIFEEGLEKIAGGAFRDCSGLSGSIVFPDTLKTIDTNWGYDKYGAFGGCTGITSVQFGASLEYIGMSAFSSCYSLQTIIWGEAIKTISNHAFWNCSEINMEFYLPDSLEIIGSGAFCGCSKLYGNLIIPNSVTSVGQEAFINCTGLNGYLSLSEQLTDIPWGTFQNCSGLQGDLIIPDSVTSIQDFAFSGCSGFTSLTLSQNLTYLSGGVFYNCTGFTGNLVLPSTLTKIDASYRGWFGVYHAGTFENCTGFSGNLIIPENVEMIELNAFKGCTGFSGSLIIPDNVTTIGQNAFAHCTNLSGLVIVPDNVQIGSAAFDNNVTVRTIGSLFSNVTLWASKDKVKPGEKFCPMLSAVCLADFIMIDETEYRYELWQGDALIQLKDWSDDPMPNFTVLEEGQYILKGIIRIGDYSVDTNDVNINIVNSPNTSFYVHSTSTKIVLGEEVDFFTSYFGGSDDCEFKFDLYQNNTLVSSTGWNRCDLTTVLFSEIGIYYMVAYVRDNINGIILSDFTQTLTVRESAQEGECEEPEDQRIEILEMTQFGSSLYWPIYEGAYKDYYYNLRIAWRNNTKWTNGVAYNIFLTDHCSDENIIKLNAIPISNTSITFSSDQLIPFMHSDCKICSVFVKIEIIDSVTGEILCSVTNEKEFRTVVLESYLTYEREMLKLSFQYSVSLHDYINRGGYIIGDVYTPSSLETASFYTAELYKAISGDWQDMNLLYTTRGAMLADFIMRKEAAKKPAIAATTDIFESFLDMFGLCWDGLNVGLDQSIYVDEEAVKGFFKEAMKISNPESVFDTIENLDMINIDDLVEQIFLAWWNYVCYSGVQRSDVQKYIDLFFESEDIGLQYSAICLCALTDDWAVRLMYHIELHGGKYFESLVSSTLYRLLADGIFGYTGGKTWEALVSGVNYIANAVCNAQGMFDSTIDLHAICNLAEETREKYLRIYQLFVCYPAEYYDQFIHEKERMLSFLEIEYNYYIEARNQVFASPVNSFLIGTAQLFMGKPIGHYDMPVEEYLANIRSWVDPLIEDYYNIWVAPIRGCLLL